jgi:N-acetylglucosaminyl-diphospho-decaprenol L-rhamnosyltransferase
VILTVNYHCSALVTGLIEASESDADPDLHILVVDNSPNDPGLDALIHMPAVTVLRASANLGFGAGCNLGLAHAEQHHPGAIVWLLNPDARLLPGALTVVRQALAEDPGTAVLGTRIRDLQGRIWFDRGRFDPWLGRLLHRPRPGELLPLHGEGGLSEPSDWLSGCSLLLDLARLKIQARFDPQMFLDYEDAELCLRLARQGYPAHVTRAVLVEHAVSAITARVPRAKYRHATFSKLYLLHNHATALALVLNLLYFWLRPLSLLPQQRAQALGRWAGLVDYVRWWARRCRGDQQVKHPRTRFTDPF